MPKMNHLEGRPSVCTDSAIDGVVAMPLGSPVRTPDGQVTDLPWRK
jgi:hypothetical protein